MPSKKHITGGGNNTTAHQTEAATAAPPGGLSSQDTLGNQFLSNQIEGITGRTFNRILGESDTNPDTGHRSFDADDLETYLKERLDFASGEMFSSAKRSGAAKALVEELDADGNGKVDWAEFQAYRQQMLAVLAPDISEGASSGEISTLAAETFDGLQTDGDISYDKAKATAKERIPEDTKHRDLAAQLAALLLLDAADVNEQDVSPRDRTLSVEEWTEAANDLTQT